MTTDYSHDEFMDDKPHPWLVDRMRHEIMAHHLRWPSDIPGASADAQLLLLAERFARAAITTLRNVEAYEAARR